MKNSVDSDRTAHLDQSDMGLHCFLIPVCLNTYIFSSPEPKAQEELIG